MSPSTVSAHRQPGGEVDEMEPRAGGAGERLEAPPFRPPPLKPWLLLEVRLHIHARLGASENDEIRHRRRMTARRISSLIWISFGIAPRKLRSRKCEGARRPLQKSPAAIAWPVIARPVVARPIPVIPGAVVRPRPVVPIVVRAPETASPSVADHADLLDVGDLRHRRCGRDRAWRRPPTMPRGHRPRHRTGMRRRGQS